MKAFSKILSVVAFSAMACFGLSACNSSNIPCSVSSTATVACSIQGVSAQVTVPPDVGLILGIVNSTVHLPNTVTTQSVTTSTAVPASVASAVKCTLSTRDKMMYCRNDVTGKSASFPVSQTATVGGTN